MTGVVRGLTTNDAGKARPADLGTGTPDASTVLAGDGSWVAKGLAKPATPGAAAAVTIASDGTVSTTPLSGLATTGAVAAKLTKPSNPSAPAVPVIAADGSVSTTLVSALGGGANITGGGATADTWVTATAYTAGRIIAVSGKTYAAKDSHTSGATFAGDLTAHWALIGVDPAVAAETVADDTVLTLGVTTDNDPALAVSTSTVLANGSTDGIGHIPFIVDGEVVFIDVNLTALGLLGAVTGVPDAPTGLTATPGVQEVALSWTAPADHGDSAISDYTIQHRIGSGAWSTFTHTASTATTATITGLTADTLYGFRVRAVNTEGAGAWTAEVTATPTAPLTVSQHDTFNRSDAGVIGVSDDGYSWAVTPLPNIVSDPTGATPSSGWSIGIRSNHLATISQPGGGAYLISRTAPADDGASPPVAVGYHARWRIPTTGTPFTRNIRYVACFVDYQNFLYVQGDQLRAMVNGTISSLGNGTGYGSLAGMVVGVEVNAARTQARLRVDASDDGGVSWPESIRTFGSIPVSLRGSDVVGVMSTFVDGGTPPYFLTDEFWVAPV